MQDIGNNNNNNQSTNEKSSPAEQKTDSQVIQINHGEQLSPSNSIQISLIKPLGMEPSIGPADSQQPDQLIQIHFRKTKVQDIKTHISATWRGKPKTDGIRLIARGRILNDPESVGEALAKPPEDSLSTHPIHVVIRPNAWTEKLEPPRPLSAPPAATKHLPVPISPIPSNLRSASQSFANLSSPTNVQGDTNEAPSLLLPSRSNFSTANNGSGLSNSNNPSSPGVLFNTYFSGLTAYGRFSFIQNIFQAQFKITERLDFLRHQLHTQHLKLLGISHPLKNSNANSDPNLSDRNEREWKRVEGKLISLLTELKFPPPYSGHADSANSEKLLTEFDPLLPDECSEFKRVEIAGLPYLLYIPESVSQLSTKDGSTGTSSALKEYKTLQRDLNRTLRLEAQVQYLILQAQKTQANLNQMDEIIAAGLRPQDALGNDREVQQAQRIFDGLFPPNAFPFPRPPGGPALGLGLGLGPAADGHHPPNNFMLPNGPLWQHPMARVRRYEFTINLDSIRRYMAPLLWLSLKLSVLLYIFGRQASYGKLVILIMIALGWVIWEAYTIHQRHDAQARRRDRLQRGQQAPGAAAGAAAPAADPIQAVLDRGRRRAERERQQLLREQRQRVDGILGIDNQEGGAAAPNNPQPAPIAAPAQPAQPAGPPAVVEAPAANPPAAAAPRRNVGRGGLRAAAADIRARGGAFPPGTEVRPFRSTSAFSPKYWFNSIAVVGLASEYRELGLHSIGERAMGASNLEYPRWYRYLRNLKTGLVLFIGTLLPEIEKKRRKALEKRARILNLVIADAARDTNNQNRNPPQPQQPRVPGPATEPNNNGPATTPPLASATNIAQTSVPQTPNTRAATSGDGQDNQQTPRAVEATALERVGSAGSEQTLSHRRPHLAVSQSGELALGSNGSQRGESAETIERASSGRSNILGKASQTERVVGPTSRRAEPSGSSSSSSSVPPAPPLPSTSSSSSSSSTAPQQQLQQQTRDENLPLDNPPPPSPLTPLDTPQVVGGLDDTDDEEIIGAENEEAGMLLF
ncbi:uncharacterized protein PGTG_11831 [Puccinia graminis f. sp. tritici CRL 75-36-700-3]|uniref:Ubiquitin-like domain-containing protein n=1 Tax=Puccinia graminis f. sp. tritici (strain CRL 75-36-700-3 / race SCCL) TaxID=418459 RepID=E3KMF0_PUCGT|nr:uncharacterized protein PGTG_11831 [Puccinia graminis f. sp. tritici CRL 75-36-700-3]EFP85475.2 hypothetical protein PGTG_11831 [Puccinia graminis f. sp. tritici CRL 75-36-700-3]